MEVEHLDDVDYLVVGGGTAGSVIAARLSEDPQLRVVLLEAGPLTGPAAMASPVAWPTLLGTEVDWAFTSVPQVGLGGRTVPYPRGKALGGSSAINAMAHLRGHRSNYDGWAAEGAAGWGYEDLLPYFRRSETAPGRNPRYRGMDGPMRVGVPPEISPFTVMALEAVAERGYPLTDDLSGVGQEGASLVELNVVGGVRQSAADAYLRPVLHDRPNLTVLSGALVHRLIISGERCEGVEFALDGGAPQQVRAAREVVLCGGAFGSPQLLMLSGIGPADELRAHGIDVVADLPGVGGTLQDHPVATIVYSATQAIPQVPNTATLFAALRSDPVLQAPDVQLMFMDFPFYPVTGTGAEGGFSVVISGLLTGSRGRVRLSSADPEAAPLIDPGFYADEADLDVMLAGLRLARDIAGAEAFAELRDKELRPGAETHTLDEQRAYLRRETRSAQHPVGTCRIGSDNASVVDPCLRVHGLSGLRVADAAVMPSVIGANTNATVLAIAERAADLIAQ